MCHSWSWAQWWSSRIQMLLIFVCILVTAWINIFSRFLSLVASSIFFLKCQRTDCLVETFLRPSRALPSLVNCWVIISCSNQSVLTTHCSFPASLSPQIFGEMHFCAPDLTFPQFSSPQSDLCLVGCCVFVIPLSKPPFCSSFLLASANLMRPERSEVFFRTVTNCHRHLSSGHCVSFRH